jgi:hypothetical protein
MGINWMTSTAGYSICGHYTVYVEKNFMSTVDREKNEPINFGRSETQEIIRSNNPSIKATLFWSRNESKRVTGMEHQAWTSCRIQETRKTMAVLD